MPEYFTFHIHGDNIVECERAILLIKQSLMMDISSYNGPFGIPVCPSYQLELKGVSRPILFTLFPGFGRWNSDILGLVRARGGRLREAADVIITGVTEDSETPLAAIEFCGALPAGNQAWQRSGRAYSFGKAEIPYLYVAELGGYELGEDRVRRAPRMPNPAVPFSYVAFSLTHETSILPVFVTAPGADAASRVDYAGVFAEAELLAFVRANILGLTGGNEEDEIRLKALSFVEIKAGTARAGETLTPSQWQAAYSVLEQGNSLVDFLVTRVRLGWTKTAYIEGMTQTARDLMDGAAKLAVGLTSSKLPMCIIPKDKRPAFATLVERLCGGRIQADFLTWLRQDKHLSICWVMGFKPRGDDARPDRGLPPLTRMLVGEGEDLLTVVYGPAPASTWTNLHNTPRRLLANGLWEAIFEISDAVLIDSSTDGVRNHGYLRPHWHEESANPDQVMALVQPAPLHIGENDVDTVLHVLLAYYAGTRVFEGMCNPPGGDWSGVSIQSANRDEELRWLTLPRVSNEGAKRPDHVFQFFLPGRIPIILSVESKETASSVESNIGPRLTNYIKQLMRTPASVCRAIGTVAWAHSTISQDVAQFSMASAVAFKSDSEGRIASVRERAAADLMMSFTFSDSGDNCVIRLIPSTQLGSEIAVFMATIPLAATSIRVVVDPL